MKQFSKHTRKGEQGFTLVELAIVMIIIGLLIGGVLKGQELITNARVAATVSQMKGVDAAVSTFRDSYSAWPGDILAPGNRLPNCTTAPCNVVGTQTGGAGVAGDGRIAQNNFASSFTVGTEAQLLWVHLAAADVFSGVQNVAAPTGFGTTLPGADIGGGYLASFSTDGALPARLGTGAVPRPGTYIVLTANPAAVPAAASGVVAADLVRRLDEKIDDGSPNIGSAIAFGTAVGVNGCATAGADNATYPVNGQGCGMYLRIQQ